MSLLWRWLAKMTQKLSDWFGPHRQPPIPVEEVKRMSDRYIVANKEVVQKLNDIKSEAHARGMYPIEVLMSRILRK